MNSIIDIHTTYFLLHNVYFIHKKTHRVNKPLDK